VRLETVCLDLPTTAGAFARRLHDAGLPMTPARSADLARALALVKPISRRRLYWTARAIVVTDPTHVPVFDAVFAAVFGPHEVEAPERPAPPSSAHEGLHPGERDGDRVVDVPVPVPSDDEVLADKRFDALEPHELAHLYQLMSRLRLEAPRRRTRRYEHGRGRRLDMRRTLRGSLRTAGEPLRLARRRRRVQRRRLVLLCDISGSMEPYARAYLQFLTSAAGSDRRAEAFVFATRLTRLTRALASRNPERAIQRAAETAPDWSSGTRIGDALKAFNDRHGRRGVARGAVVVIISDGWERGDPALVGREMGRLARLAHRIVWVNPRLSASRFSVRAGGMVAALPHCDVLVSGHSFAALGDVVAAIGGADFEPPDVEPEPEESWASATPVAGSSVAMPSGYGPRRGRTTPGWK
jgi:uncharacterized protein with von Willebrand factor type A (vWA) domain